MNKLRNACFNSLSPAGRGQGEGRRLWFGIPLVIAGLYAVTATGADDAQPASTNTAQPATKEASAAKEKAPYQAMGAPSDPKVPANWNRYHDHAAATELLQQLAKTHPARCRLQSLGKSYGNRDMWVLTITNFDRGKDTDKPAFWIDGGIHANEIQSVEVALYTAWYLLEMDGRSPFITRLLDERVFYVMPMLSPDSRDAHMYEANSTHSPRSGLRPVDNDLDGLFDEDGPDDLDGDGNITQMRVRDPNGRYKVHPDHPNLLIPCEPDEKGQYTLLGTEGYDNDGDGLVNEDGPGGYDPNRDWPWNWQPKHVQLGAYRYPFSVLENRMVADFIMAHPNIAGAQSFHNAAGMILRGPGAKDDRFDKSDIAVYDAIGKRGEKVLPGYKYVDIATGLYEVYGGEVDWFHQMLGVFTFTNELFTEFNFFRQPEPKGFQAEQAVREDFNKYLLFDDGLVPWHEVDHPQFGKIEVGGFKKNWVRQPPSFLLEEECHRNMAFTLYHADQMPQLSVQSIDVKSLGANLSEVTATIANAKLIPTHSAADVKNKLTPPDIASLTGNNIKVLTASVSDSRFFEHPKEQKNQPAEARIASVPGMEAMYVRWLVEGAGPYTVTVKSAKGGTASATK